MLCLQATTLKSVLRLIMHEVGSDNKNMTMVWERRAQKPSFVRYAGLVEAVTAIA